MFKFMHGKLTPNVSVHKTMLEHLMISWKCRVFKQSSFGFLRYIAICLAYWLRGIVCCFMP